MKEELTLSSLRYEDISVREDARNAKKLPYPSLDSQDPYVPSSSKSKKAEPLPSPRDQSADQVIRNLNYSNADDDSSRVDSQLDSVGAG